jgi:hypothetical protein
MLNMRRLAIKILKGKLQEYLNLGRPEPNFPEYALHPILLLYSTHPEMVSSNFIFTFMSEPR